MFAMNFCHVAPRSSDTYTPTAVPTYSKSLLQVLSEVFGAPVFVTERDGLYHLRA